MKAITSICTLTVLLLIQSCGKQIADKHPDRNPKAIQSCETYGGDTINRTDVSGQKQGHWEIRKFVACTKTVL